MASQTSQRWASGTDAATVLKLAACSRLRRVPPATARPAGSASRSSTPVDCRHRLGIDLGGQPAGQRELVQMAEEPEAGDVGERVGAAAQGGG